MEEKAPFPFEEFTLWLKDAMTVGQIVNKLMATAKSEQRGYMTVEEQELLVAVQQKVAGQYPTLEVLVAVSFPHYPVY